MGDDEALALVNSLTAKIRAGLPEIDKLDKYYRGRQPLSFLHPDIALEVGERLWSLVINWPRLVLDSLEERLDIAGFRMPGDDMTDASIWKVWQANGFDLESGLCHLDAMKHGRCFVSVWWEDGDNHKPRYAVESARQMAVDWEPGTRRVRAALKSWQDRGVSYANLFLADRLVKYKRGGDSTAGLTVVSRSAAGSWQQYDEISHDLGRPPVVPFVNRYDTDMPDGESELTDVIPLADAVNKLATDMMVSSEFHAMPRRWATGIEIPGSNNPAEKTRLEAEAKQYWERATAGKVWLAGKDVNFGQFQQADLSNFIGACRFLAATVSAITGIPPHELGVMGDANPASADAIRSSEAKTVRRAKRKQRTFDEPWEQVQVLGLMVRDGAAPESSDELETVWCSAETPTLAQTADATVKLKVAGIIDDVQAQEDIGYSPAQRERIAQRRATAITGGALDEATAERVRTALELVDKYGVDAKVAFASVGLIQPPKTVVAGPDAPPMPEGDLIDPAAA